jgi:hypothetical protein
VTEDPVTDDRHSMEGSASFSRNGPNRYRIIEPSLFERRSVRLGIVLLVFGAVLASTFRIKWTPARRTETINTIFQAVKIAPPPAEPPPPPPPESGTLTTPNLSESASAAPPKVITNPSFTSSFNMPKVEIPTPDISVINGTSDGRTNRDGTGQTHAGAGLGNGLGTQLSELLFALTCSDNGSCDSTINSSLKVALTDALPHTCTLRVRGLAEQATYAGGSTDGYLCKGGTPDTGVYNVYELDVDNPRQTYYLNAGQSGIRSLFALDYTFDIQIHDGSKITLHADSIDRKEIPNKASESIPDDDQDQPLAVRQPFQGQFIQIDAIAIK